MNAKLLSLLVIVFILKLVKPKAVLDAKKHLFEYGYLNSMEADQATFEAALKRYQKYFDLAITGNVDEATVKTMSTRRCGRPDNAAQFFETEEKWRKRHLTYTIRNWTEPFTKSTLRSVFDKAFTQWTNNVNLFVTESNANKSDIDIYFTKQDGRYNILGYAFFPENGDIYFDLDEYWTLNKPSCNLQTYFGWVAGHEMGHSLGLKHSSLRGSIMFPYYSTDVTEPTELDNSMLKALYQTNVDYNNSILCKNSKIDGLLQTPNKQKILFKGDQYWLFSNFGLESGPFPLDSLYPGLPENIDCAFSVGKSMYILKDDVFYKYRPQKKTYAKKLISMGFDNLPSNIDAAFFNSQSRIIYFFKGDKFYEFNTTKKTGKRLSLDGASISKFWVGIPNNIEAATLLEDNIILFIKKSRCYMFNLGSRTVVDKEDCKKYFLKC